jgi:arabinoxylan arabinofuranohydrolase
LNDGSYVFTNVNSGKVLGIDQMMSGNGAKAVQTADTGTTAAAWKVTEGSSGAFRLVNSHSTKVLGVDRMLTSDGANALQWNDNATNDQFWKFLATQ